MQSILPSGIYPPLPTFFDENDELDLSTLRLHMMRIAGSGIAGYVVLGTNGEAAHLSEQERLEVIVAAREIVARNDKPLPLIAGCGDQGTRTTIERCKLAAREGADIALILPPSYYKGQMDRAALLAHFRAVADQSPLPILLYNMPASAAGLDMDATTISMLAEHPNIIGVKDSSGNIVKLAEVVASVPANFRVLAGNAGFLLAALTVGVTGAITALANVFPRAVCQLQNFYEARWASEARTLQLHLIPINAAVTTRYGVPGLKAALQLTLGYGGKPRLPLLPLPPEDQAVLQEILQNLPSAQ